MNKREISKADTAQLLSAYKEAAQTQGAATEAGDYKLGNKASDLLAAIYAELRRRGKDSQRELLQFLSDHDPGVRLWAASHALEFSPDEAKPVLESLIPVGIFLGLSAKMTLEQWQDGRLKFP